MHKIHNLIIIIIIIWTDKINQKIWKKSQAHARDFYHNKIYSKHTFHIPILFRYSSKIRILRLLSYSSKVNKLEQLIPRSCFPSIFCTLTERISWFSKFDSIHSSKTFIRTSFYSIYLCQCSTYTSHDLFKTIKCGWPLLVLR